MLTGEESGVSLCALIPPVTTVGENAKGRAIRYKSSLVPRCGLSAAIPYAGLGKSRETVE